MQRFGEAFSERRVSNANSLAAFQIRAREEAGSPLVRVVHEGTGAMVYTIGYERRSLPNLAELLLAFRVDLVIDVRQNPTSRRAGFRESELRRACESSGLRYESWTSLGATQAQRDALRENGNVSEFKRRFRQFVRRHRRDELRRLRESVRAQRTVLLCYERSHDDCHRSVLSDLLHEQSDASVLAVV